MKNSSLFFKTFFTDDLKFSLCYLKVRTEKFKRTRLREMTVGKTLNLHAVDTGQFLALHLVVPPKYCPEKERDHRYRSKS